MKRAHKQLDVWKESVGVKVVHDSRFTFHVSRPLQMLFIAVVGLITYSNTFHVPFQFDDFPNLADNPLIKNLGNFISSSHGYDFNPRRFIGYLSFALNYHFGGLNVTGYHIVNLSIHITNSLLVYLIVVLTFRTPYMRTAGNHEVGKLRRCEDAKRLSTSQLLNFSTSDNSAGIAFFSALLFAAHPVQTQAVTYIVQRFASLAAMFYLCSVVAYIKARILTEQKTEGAARMVRTYAFYLLSIISAVLAMKTKEIAFTLPVVIILYEFAFFKSTLKKKLIFILPILVTMLIIPISILGTNRPLGAIISDVSENLRVQSNLSRWDYLMTQMRVITTYIRLIFLPVRQNLDYDYPVYHSLLQLPVFLSFLFLSAVLGTGVYLLIGNGQWARGNRLKAKEPLDSPVKPENDDIPPRSLPDLIGQSRLLDKEESMAHDSRLFRLIGFGILWFFITLSLESSVIPIADVIFEHRLYLPSAGAFIAITTAVFMVSARWKGMERAVVAAFLLIIMALAGASYSRNMVWQDGVRLWEDVALKSPRNARAYNNLGAEFKEKKMYAKAINEFRMAILLKPDYAEAHYNLGVVYQALNRFNEAVEHYLMAVKLKPDYAWAHLNLGDVYYQVFNMPDKAEKEFLTAVSLMPDFAEAHFNLALIYQNRNMPDKAIEQYLIDIKLRPDHAASYNNLGFVYYKTGQVEKARSELASALTMQPDNITAQNLLNKINKQKDRQ